MRRRVIVGGITLLLLMGCNNGGELEAQKRLGEIGRSVEGVFYSFVDFIADTLGFTVKADITKQKVGEHFVALGKKLGEASAKLEEVAKKSETDNDKNDSSKNLIREAVEGAKATLSALQGHLEALRDVGDASQKAGEAVSGATQGTTVSDGELKIAYNALKGIVEESGKVGVKKPIAGSAALNVTGVDNKDGAKILSTSGGATSTDAAKAAAILSSVSGDEILASIVESKDVDAALGATTPNCFNNCNEFCKRR